MFQLVEVYLPIQYFHALLLSDRVSRVMDWGMSSFEVIHTWCDDVSHASWFGFWQMWCDSVEHLLYFDCHTAQGSNVCFMLLYLEWIHMCEIPIAMFAHLFIDSLLINLFESCISLLVLCVLLVMNTSHCLVETLILHASETWVLIMPIRSWSELSFDGICICLVQVYQTFSPHLTHFVVVRINVLAYISLSHVMPCLMQVKGLWWSVYIVSFFHMLVFNHACCINSVVQPMLWLCSWVNAGSVLVLELTMVSH